MKHAAGSLIHFRKQRPEMRKAENSRTPSAGGEIPLPRAVKSHHYLSFRVPQNHGVRGMTIYSSV